MEFRNIICHIQMRRFRKVVAMENHNSSEARIKMSYINAYIAPGTTQEIQDRLYELYEKYNGINGNWLRRWLNQLLEQDPYCFDAYLFRYQILMDEDNRVAADKELKKAYLRAVELICRDTGEWPEFIPWEILENRPLLRALYGGVEYNWWKGEPAMEILRKLLKVCPNDNLGARFALLALKMAMSHREWVELQDKVDLAEWFQENAKKFPEEFGEG